MADKSKKEQYDIVAQAEDVLEAYIRRCFSAGYVKKPKRFYMRHFWIGAGLISIAGAVSGILIHLI